MSRCSASGRHPHDVAFAALLVLSAVVAVPLALGLARATTATVTDTAALKSPQTATRPRGPARVPQMSDQIGSAPVSDAPSGAPADEPIEFEPAWSIGGWAEAVALRGETVFAGFGADVVAIDFADATSPRRIGDVRGTGGAIRRLLVAGDYLYVVDDLNGVGIVNIADASNMREVWRQQARDVHDVAVDGAHAFAIGSSGLTAFAIGDLGADGAGAVRAVGAVDTPGDGRAIEVADRRAYVADGMGGLRAYDVTSPVAVQELGSLDVSPADDVAARGDVVFVAAGGWLRVIDAGEPAAMRELSHYEIPDRYVHRVSVAGSHAFVGLRDGGLRIFDVSSPSAPVLAYAFDRGWGECSGSSDQAASTAVVGSGGRVFAAMLERGIAALSLGVPPDISVLGEYAVPLACAQHVTAAAGYVYASSGRLRLEVIDARGSEPGTIVATLPVTDVRSLAVASGRLYVALPGKLDIWDVRRPERPGRLATWDASGRGILDVAVADSVVYLATTEGVSVLAAGDPSQPREIGRLDSPGASASQLAVAGLYAYVIGSSRLRIADVSAPAAMRWLGAVELSEYLFDVSVIGHHALTVDAWHGLLHVVDATDAAAPRLVTSMPLPMANARLTATDELVIAAGHLVEAYALRSAAAPVAVGRGELRLVARDLATAAGSLYVANGSHGLLAARLSSPTSGAWSVLDGLAALYEPDPIACPREPSRRAGVYAYRCRIAAGHQFSVSLEPFGDAAEAAAAWDTLRAGDEARLFHGHKAFSRQVDDSPNPNLPLRHRLHVWQADRWLVTVDAFDDTGIPASPAPLELSEVVFATGTGVGLWVEGSETDAGATLYLPYANRPVVVDLEPVARLGGVTESVASSGDYVYLGSGTRVLVVDASERRSPRVVAQSDRLPGVVRDIEVTRGHLLVSVQPDGGRGPFLLSTDSPARLPVVGEYGPLGARDVAVRGHRAYVAAGAGGLVIFDVSDPVRPLRIGAYAGRPPALAVAAGDRFIAVAEDLGDDDFVYRVLDVADPARPTAVVTVDRAREAGAAFVGDLLYVVDWRGLSVYAAPAFERIALLDDAAGTSIAVAGSHAYVAGIQLPEGGSVAVIDVARPRAPVRVDSCDPATDAPCGRLDAGSVAAVPGWVFAARTITGAAGLTTIDVGQPRRPAIAGSLDLIGAAYGKPDLWESTLFLDDASADTIRLVDIAAPERPIALGSSIGQARDGFAVRDGFAYRASFLLPRLEGTLEAWDVRIPMRPKALVPLRWPPDRRLHDLAESGEALLVADSHYPSVNGSPDASYVSVVDDAWTTAPRVSATLGPFEGSAVGIAAADGYGYLVCTVGAWAGSEWRVTSRLHVLDVREPARASVIASLELEGETSEPDVCNGMVFLAPAASGGGEIVVDVREPARPRLVAPLADAYGSGWVCLGPYAFAAPGRSLDLLDTSATPPRVIARYADLSEPSGIAGGGGHLYVADGEAGLVVLRFSMR